MGKQATTVVAAVIAAMISGCGGSEPEQPANLARLSSIVAESGTACGSPITYTSYSLDMPYHFEFSSDTQAVVCNFQGLDANTSSVFVMAYSPSGQAVADWCKESKLQLGYYSDDLSAAELAAKRAEFEAAPLVAGPNWVVAPPWPDGTLPALMDAQKVADNAGGQVTNAGQVCALA